MERIYNINNSTLRVVFGNILESDAEVIVSSDDAFLSMGGGVSGAIFSAAGIAIKQDTHKHDSLSLGDVIVTTAGEMKQKYIFHAVTISKEKRLNMRYGRTGETIDVQRYVIRHSVDKCCKLLSAIGLTSIAFPAIGAGAAGISYTIVAQEMSNVLANSLYRTNQKLSVELYLYDRTGSMSNMDFIEFFENIAISIHDAKIAYENSLKLEDNQIQKEQSVPKVNKIVLNDNDLTNRKKRDIFISYSRKDSDVVNPVCRALQDAGLDIWIDVEGKYHGKNFREVIVDAIESVEVVLFFSSQASNDSYYVQQEISIAVEKQKFVIPVILDGAKFSKKIYFDLVNIDYIDYREHNDKALKELIEDILCNLNT